MTKYDEFEEKVNKTIEEQNNSQNQIVNDWNQLRDSYKGNQKSFAPIKKGIIFTTMLCPICGEELHYIVVRNFSTYRICDYVGYTSERRMYMCNKCNYKYAHEDNDRTN